VHFCAYCLLEFGFAPQERFVHTVQVVIREPKSEKHSDIVALKTFGLFTREVKNAH